MTHDGDEPQTFLEPFPALEDPSYQVPVEEYHCLMGSPPLPHSVSSMLPPHNVTIEEHNARMGLTQLRHTTTSNTVPHNTLLATLPTDLHRLVTASNLAGPLAIKSRTPIWVYRSDVMPLSWAATSCFMAKSFSNFTDIRDGIDPQFLYSAIRTHFLSKWSAEDVAIQVIPADMYRELISVATLALGDYITAEPWLRNGESADMRVVRLTWKIWENICEEMVRLCVAGCARV